LLEVLVKVLKRALEDKEEEGLEEAGVMEDMGLEKQGFLVDGIAFEHAGFLDCSRLLEVKVVVVAFLFAWWACVLGKTGTKVEHICLCWTLPWFGLASSIFAVFGIPVIRIKRLFDVGSLSGVHSLFLDWKPTQEVSCWLTRVGPTCVISAKGLLVSPVRYSTSWLPVSHSSLGGVTDLQGGVCILLRESDGFPIVQPIYFPAGSFCNLRTVLQCGSPGTSKAPPTPMLRVSGDRFFSFVPE